jgi:hypothetical protein
MIGRRLPASSCSSSPAPAGAALRALQLDPGPRDGANRQRRGKATNQSRPTRRPTTGPGPIQHALLTTGAPMGAPTAAISARSAPLAAWSAAIPACTEPEVSAAQHPDQQTPEPSSLIFNSALWCMGRYGAMGCVGPRPRPPPSESDSCWADALVTGIFDSAPGVAPTRRVNRRRTAGPGKGPSQSRADYDRRLAGVCRARTRSYPLTWRFALLACSAVGLIRLPGTRPRPEGHRPGPARSGVGC